MNRDIIAVTKYKFNVYGKKDIRSGRDSAVVGIVGKSKSLDFPTMLIFWSLVRNSVVLAVYLLFSVACFLTVHEHCLCGLEQDSFPERLKLLSFQSGKISRNAFAPMTKVIKWMAGKIKDEENYRSRVSGMDAAVALQRKKTIKFLCIVDFSLSKQGIFFITLTQKPPFSP